MANNLNRRQLLKAGALLAGGLPLSGGILSRAVAAPAEFSYTEKLFTDRDFGLNAPPTLKARLFANENPFGPSDKAKKAIEEAMAGSYQYPFMYTRELQEKIAATEGLKPNNILMSAGSSALLMAAAMYFSKDGGSVISGDPSYEDLPYRAMGYKGKWVKVPLTTDYKLDLDAMEKAVDANTKLVYICNPNNPTGTVLDKQKLVAFCDRVSTKTTVFIDEAYIDYLDDPKGMSMMDAVKKGQNVIVARTFSKLYGFAGLRVGYMAASPAMIDALDPLTSGENCLSATSIKAALAAYQDTPYLQDALKKTMASKEYLYSVLKKEGYEYIPSSANFVMFPIKMEGQKFAGEMMKRGVGVRFWKFNSKDWCRVSIGRMDEMEAFAAAFKEIS